jgi:hypothetical protein
VEACCGGMEGHGDGSLRDGLHDVERIAIFGDLLEAP